MDIILNSILNIFVFLVIFVLPVYVIGTVITEIYNAYLDLKKSNHG